MKIPRYLRPFLLLLISFGACIAGAQAAERVMPDPETAAEAECLAQVPRALERMWSSKDLDHALKDGLPGLGLAIHYWTDNRQPPGPDAAKRLARIADLCLPLAQRGRIEINSGETSLKDHCWRYASKDWLVELDIASLKA